MAKAKQLIQKLSFQKVLLISLVLFMISTIWVSSTFAKYQATVTGIGETSIADWGVDVLINGYADGTAEGDIDATDSIIFGTNLALAKDEVNNLDNNIYAVSGKVTYGSEGYMPIEFNGSDAEVSMLISIKAYFINLPEGFVFTDNLGRNLTLKGATDFTPTSITAQQSSSPFYEKPAKYVEYFYFLSYNQAYEWAKVDNCDIYLNLGFRWAWEDEDTSSETYPQIYNEIRVTATQITNEFMLPPEATVINFVGSKIDLITDDDNTLNVLTKDICTESIVSSDAKACTINATDNFYLDVNGKATADNVYKVVSSSGKDIVLGTLRRELDYISARPYAEIDAPTSYAIVSGDFKYDYEKINAVNLKVQNLVNSLNNILLTQTKQKSLYDTLTIIDANKGATLTKYGISDFDSLETAIASCGDDDNIIVWDTTSKLFAYIQNGSFVQSYSNKQIIKSLTNNYSLFRLYDCNYSDITGNIYSIYLADNTDTTIDNLTVGLDVGNSAGITSITYDRATATTAQEVIIRTNSNDSSLTVNAPLDTVSHIDKDGNVTIM